MKSARNEDGFAVVAAVVLLTVIMGLGLGLLLFSDTQQKAANREQASEAAFNVAEAALNAEVGQLSREWPTKTELPASCTASTSAETGCPGSVDLKLDPNTSSATCSGKDAWGGSLSNQWTTYVRRDLDETGPFNSTQEEGAARSAASETGALWVRAIGVVQCHPVAVISLVTRQRVALKLPIDAITGNWFKITNSGKKTIVDRKGKAAEAAPVSMRCESLSNQKCEEYEVEKEQVSPAIVEDPKSAATTLTTSELATLKSEAVAAGTFYSPTSPYHCPSNVTELGGVTQSTGYRAPVYMEGCGELKITATGIANSEASPGFLILANGTLELSGNSTYYGVIYDANLQKNSGAVVKLHGNTQVIGGIIVDGLGGLEFGSSGQGKQANLVFDSLAIDNQTISAGAASTRNSFRILPAGQ